MKKHLSYFMGNMLLPVLSLTSCESIGSSGPLTMKIGLAGIAEEESASLRRTATGAVVSERIALASGDALVVEWHEDPPSPLRATRALTDGATFRVVALKSSDKTLIDYEDCINRSNNGVLSIENGVASDFICYSFDTGASLSSWSSYVIGSTFPTTSLNIGNTATNTLYYWGAWNEMPTTESVGEIVLTPQLAKIKLVLDCSDEGNAITGVGAISVGALATTGTFNLATGAISATLGAQQFTSWTGLNSTMATSAPISVLPRGTNSLTLTIPRNAITLSGASKQLRGSATLSNIAIEAGKSYTLQVKMKKEVSWAGSNVFWNGSALTFVRNVNDPLYGRQGDNDTSDGIYYQGVYFKGGSNIGISPVGVFDPNTTPIYVYTSHNNISHYEWRETTVAEAYSRSFISNYFGYEDFTSPTWEGIPASGYDICEDLSYEPSSLAIYRYHMPHPSDIVSSITNVGSNQSLYNGSASAAGWSYELNGSSSGVISTDHSGQQKFGYPYGLGGGIGSGAYATNSGTIFPAAGYRSSDGSLSSDVGVSGYYWCDPDIYSTYYGSAGSTYCFRFSSPNSLIMEGWSNDCAFPIRCIYDPRSDY